jgi:hypothetical protein
VGISLAYDTNNSLEITWHKVSFGAVEVGETDGIVTVSVECRVPTDVRRNQRHRLGRRQVRRGQHLPVRLKPGNSVSGDVSLGPEPIRGGKLAPNQFASSRTVPPQSPPPASCFVSVNLLPFALGETRISLSADSNSRLLLPPSTRRT